MNKKQTRSHMKEQGYNRRAIKATLRRSVSGGARSLYLRKQQHARLGKPKLGGWGLLDKLPGHGKRFKK